MFCSGDDGLCFAISLLYDCLCVFFINITCDCCLQFFLSRVAPVLMWANILNIEVMNLNCLPLGISFGLLFNQHENYLETLFLELDFIESGSLFCASKSLEFVNNTRTEVVAFVVNHKFFVIRS